jgi:hypothetical protein
MGIYNDRHVPRDRSARAGGQRVILHTRLDLAHEIAELAPYRSYPAWLNQNNAQFDCAIYQNRVQLVAP